MREPVVSKIFINKNIIYSGKRGDASLCPIAITICVGYIENDVNKVEVDEEIIELYNNFELIKVFNMSEIGRGFIIHFDSGCLPHKICKIENNKYCEYTVPFEIRLVEREGAY